MGGNRYGWFWVDFVCLFFHNPSHRLIPSDCLMSIVYLAPMLFICTICEINTIITNESLPRINFVFSFVDATKQVESLILFLSFLLSEFKISKIFRATFCNFMKLVSANC